MIAPKALHNLAHVMVLGIVTYIVTSHGWSADSPLPSSPAASLENVSRQSLQQSLQKELQQLKERELANQRALRYARLSQKQVKQEKQRLRHIQLALIHTQQRLNLLTHQITHLNTRDQTLQQQQTQNVIEITHLIPTLQTLTSRPELPFLIEHDASSSSPDNPVLIESLLSARAQLAHRIFMQTQEQRHTLHQRQERLDQTSQTIARQRQLQQQQQALETSQQERAERSRQEAEQAVLHAHALLEQSRQNMQSLNKAIEQLALKEEAERQRLRAEARRLRHAHKKGKARQAEQAVRDLNTGTGVGKGQGSSPVQGTVIVHWQQMTETGPATGLTYQTSSSAPVMAPCTGRLLFTGDFRSFGPMVILDCGHLQRFVMAGLGSITVHASQAVQRKALLGYMPHSGGNLFVQFRRGSHITDPTPFFGASP